MGVSKKVETVLGIGLATTFVMTLESIFSWLIYDFILLPLNIPYLRTMAFIFIIAVVVKFTKLAKADLPAPFKGASIALITPG